MRYIATTVPTALITAFLLATSGCASIRSARLPGSGGTQAMQGGLVYSLPTQRLKLSMIVTDDANKTTQTRTITVTPTAVSADRRTQYVAQYRRNQIGSNTLKLSVNAQGLLTGDSEGSSTPQIAEFLGQLAASGRSMLASDSSKSTGCTSAGTYEWVFDAPKDSTPATLDDGMANCGLRVTATARGAPVADDRADDGSEAPGRNWKGVDTAGNGHGYFYRQKRPVEVTVSYGAVQRKVFDLAIVDAASQTEFLPVPRTLFAETRWKVTFVEGSPTFFDVDAGGDVLGLFKLPADVLKAYSEAVLAGLKQRKDIASGESDYLKQMTALAAQQAKYEACKAAADSGVAARIKDACQ